MINPKRLPQLVKKWQKMAAMRSKRISFSISREDSNSLSASKGHFVVYTSDGTRFEIPLELLNNSMFRELLRMAEEEFELSGGGPIRLPCDRTFLDYVMLLVRRRPSQDLEQAFITSVMTCHGSEASDHLTEWTNQQGVIFSF